MVFPNNNYLTFAISSGKPVDFSFPTKKIWLDVATTSSFRFKINYDDDDGMLIHMNSTSQKSFEFPSTVNSISISTTVETPFYMTLLVEEWNN